MIHWLHGLLAKDRETAVEGEVEEAEEGKGKREEEEEGEESRKQEEQISERISSQMQALYKL